MVADAMNGARMAGVKVGATAKAEADDGEAEDSAEASVENSDMSRVCV